MTDLIRKRLSYTSIDKSHRIMSDSVDESPSAVPTLIDESPGMVLNIDRLSLASIVKDTSILKDNNVLFDMIKNHKWIEIIDFFKKNAHQPLELLDVNIRDNSNNYLIEYAIIFNKKSIVQLLLDRGSRIDMRDSDGKCIVFIPIKYNYMDILDLLLDYNVSNIGISLIEIADKAGHIPLHYAILFRNKHAIELLLKYKSNVNAQDKMGNNSLHLSIQSKEIKIVNMILNSKPNINMITKTGETALHIACTYENYLMIHTLLENGANPNIVEYEHELTPLMYAISFNRIDIVKLLLQYEADPNIQDQYGSSSLHHCLYETRWDIFEYIIANTKKIKYNVVNIEGKSILHIILEHNKLSTEKKLYYVNMILLQSNLNIQDKFGVTPLFQIVKNNLWKDLIEKLRIKKLNIYKQTRAKETILSYIASKDKKIFINMVIDGFFYEITNKKNIGKLSVKWQIDCRQNEKKCKELIHKQITIEHVSIPDINHYNIEIFPGDMIKFGTFTGITLDVLSGLIYLVQKWKSIGSTLTPNFIHNTNLNNYYKSIGITTVVDYEYMNFELTWINNKLYVPTIFKEVINNFIKKKYRFFICPLGVEMKEESHANYIIYDSTTNELERFEPHGARTPKRFNYNPDLMDSAIKQQFNETFKHVTLVQPSDYLPKIGYQILDSSESNQYKNIGDPGGFCAIWAIWYADMRLTYPDVPRKILIQKSMAIIRLNGYSFRTLIRNYSAKIVEVRDRILASANVDINQWLNDNYSVEQLNKINENIKIIINGITL
jgi:ankyrin repeat protein